VFYALDQMKMWKVMRDAGGLVPFVDRWIRGGGPHDAMIPAQQAARLLVGVLAAKLRQPVADTQADLCVTHDMTIYLLRDLLLGEPANGPAVAFLDALLLYQRDGALWMQSHHGEARRLD
jgi:hypothetical protein